MAAISWTTGTGGCLLLNFRRDSSDSTCAWLETDLDCDEGSWTVTVSNEIEKHNYANWTDPQERIREIARERSKENLERMCYEARRCAKDILQETPVLGTRVPRQGRSAANSGRNFRPRRAECR